MKKMILFVMLLVGAANVNAQSGKVNIINQLGCDIAINVYATCPDCSQYSNLAMTLVQGNGSWPGFQYYPGWASWANGDPDIICPGEWKWSYAVIQFICDDGQGSFQSYYLYVGSDVCHTYSAVDGVMIPQDCADACHGGNTNIQASWTTTANGDVQILIW